MRRLESIWKFMYPWNPMVAAIVMASAYMAALLLIGSAVTANSPTFALNCLFLVTGAAVGWLVGFMASPYSKGEAQEISKYTKVVIAAFSGWGIAEIDTFRKWISLVISFPPDANSIFRVFGFITAVIVGALVTHATRRYASGAPSTP